MILWENFVLTLKWPGGGGGGSESAPSTFRVIISWKKVVHTASICYFFFVLRNFWYYFCKNRAHSSEITQHYESNVGSKFENFLDLCTNTKHIKCMENGFSGQKLFWALKCIIAFTITFMFVDIQY